MDSAAELKEREGGKERGPPASPGDQPGGSAGARAPVPLPVHEKAPREAVTSLSWASGSPVAQGVGELISNSSLVRPPSSSHILGSCDRARGRTSKTLVTHPFNDPACAAAVLRACPCREHGARPRLPPLPDCAHSRARVGGAQSRASPEPGDCWRNGEGEKGI